MGAIRKTFSLPPHLMSGWNWFQLVNNSLAYASNILFSSLVLSGLVNEKSHFRGVKSAVASLAFSNLVIGLLDLSTFPIYVAPPGKLTFLFGQYYPTWLTLNLFKMSDVMERASNCLLGVVFLYRTIVATKAVTNPRLFFSISTPIAIVLPILQTILFKKYSLTYEEACDYWCLDKLDEERVQSGIWRWVLTEEGDILTTSIIDACYMISVAAIGVICCFKISHFYRSADFSERTKKLQRDLNRGMCLMIAVHLCIFYPYILVIFYLIKKDIHIELEITIGMMIVQTWQTPLISLVLLFSVRAFICLPFKRRNRKVSQERRTTVTFVHA